MFGQSTEAENTKRNVVSRIKNRLNEKPELFTTTGSNRKDGAIEIAIDQSILSDIWEKEPNKFSLNLPLPNGTSETLNFDKARISSGEFTVTTNDGKKLGGKEYLGVHYQLQTNGKKRLGGLSFRKGGLMGMIAHENGNYNISETSPGSGRYLISDDSKVAFPGFDCGTDDSKEDEPLHSKETTLQNKSAASTSCKTVRIAFEADFDLYTRSGNNIVTASNFVTGLFNIVKQVYQNEQINIELGGVFVWTTVDPYASVTNTFSILNSFAVNRPVSGIDGDLLHFLDCRASSLGGIAYIGALCNPSTRHGFSSIFYSYNSLPTFSWSVFCVSHELGHNFGSRHTHWCGWTLPGGGTGRIDSCFAGEGICGSTIKARKGTVMSYCYNTTGGVDLNLGFGPLPGKAIRDGLAAATCFSLSCLATATLKADSTTNFDRNFTLNIAIPANSGAVNWRINEGSTIVASGILSNQNAVNIDIPITNRANGIYSFTATLISGANLSTSSVVSITVATPAPTVVFNPGNLASGNQTICNAGDPSDIVFSTAASSGSTFQWYFQNGLVLAPLNTAGLSGWTIISGSNSANYNPPANQTTSQTFACRVTNGTNSQWATGVRQVTVLPVFSPGIIINSDETFCTSGNPVNITLSANPSGSGAYQFRWYFRETATGNCPGSATIGAEWNTNSTSPNIFGTSLDGNGISFDPMSAGNLNSGRTFALYITPIANGSSPACGTPQWAGNCRKTFVVNCSTTVFSPGTLAAGNQTICNGGDATIVSFSVNATSGSSFQWYSQNGLIPAPANTASLAGWTLISGAMSPSFDPPAGTSTSQTFACRVTNAGNSQWATGVRQVTVLPAFNPGSLMANQSGCAGYDPMVITMASNPSGSGSYNYNWYYWDNTTLACPTGSTIPAGFKTSSGDVRFFGNSANGTGISFDASSAGTSGRTWAVLITPIANSNIPACGTPQFANSCHRTFVSVCREATIAQSVESQSLDIGQNFPNPWTDQTRISYFLPEGTSNARLLIYSTEGKLVYSKTIIDSGKGEIELEKGVFAKGIYMYHLQIEGGVRTKPMKFSTF